MDDINDEKLLEDYMGGLNEDIKHNIFLRHPTNTMEAMQFSRHIQAKNKTTHKPTIGAYVGNTYHFGVHKTTIPQLISLTLQQMDEIRAKGLCFNCDNKYSKGNICSDKKVLYIHNEEEECQELELLQDIYLEETTPMIYYHELASISTPKTLKIQGYIKNKKVTMLIDYGSTHNRIN